MDGVAQEGNLIQFAISEHIENAGVHSGDATLVLPPQRTYLETTRRIKLIARKIVKALEITGPFNIQFLAKDNSIKVIECNLRASRSFPFVSKVIKQNFIEMATQGMLGVKLEDNGRSFMELEYVGVKASHFSFTRLLGADPTLGVEMSSTGEVGCLGDNFDEALLKAMQSVGFRFPLKTVLLSTGPMESKINFIEDVRLLKKMGTKLYTTTGTHEFLTKYEIESEIVYWPDENKSPNVIDVISEQPFDLVINIPKNLLADELTNGYTIRRKAVDLAIPLITNLQLAKRFIEAVGNKKFEDLAIKSWDEY